MFLSLLLVVHKIDGLVFVNFKIEIGQYFYEHLATYILTQEYLASG